MLNNNKKPRWYVISCISGQENSIADLIKVRAENTGLSEMVLDVLVPSQEKIAIRRGEKKTVKEKIFPGYILVHMVLSDATWPLIRDTQGVTNFAGTDLKPTPLRDEEVQSIIDFSNQTQSSYKVDIIEGDVVTVTQGDFKDFTGTITEIDKDKGRVKVLIQFLGREVPVELDVTHIVKQ
jgi:transcription termination/antitermination protein NusG